MKKEVSAFALVLAAVLLFVYLFNLSPTGFVVQTGTSNFSSTPSNNFINTTYSNGSITLAGNMTAGYYLSDIFGNGTNYSWSNVTWTGTVPDNSSLVLEVANCALPDCSDGVFNSTNLSNMNFTSQYFQYKVLFSRNDTKVTSPSLTGVSYDYSPVATQNATSNGTPFSVSVVSPTSGATYSNTTQLVNLSADGAESIWYNWNGTNETYNGSVYVLFPNGSTTLIAYANDTNGTVSNQSVSFTIHIPTCSDDPSLCTESECDHLWSSDYWYNGACHDSPQTQQQQNTTQQQQQNTTQQQTPIVPPQITKLTASSIATTNIVQGDSDNMTFNVKNSGTTSLTGCALKLTGKQSSWFKVLDKSKSISSGKSVDFAFITSVPLNTAVGSYAATATVSCAQTSASTNFKVDVQQKKLNVSILSVQRNRLDNVKVSYSLSDLTGKNQNVSATFEIIDANKTEIGNASDTNELNANATKDFSLNIPINSSAEGNMSLSGTFGSEKFSTTLLEPILLGAPVSGFAIGPLGTGGSLAVVLGVIVVFVVLFFGVKRLRKKAKKKSSSGERRNSESEHSER